MNIDLLNPQWLGLLASYAASWIILGVLFALGVHIGALDDKTSLKYLANTRMRTAMTAIGWIFLVIAVYYGIVFLVVTAAAFTHVLLSFATVKWQKRIVKQDRFGWFLLFSLGAIAYVVSIYPNVPRELTAWLFGGLGIVLAVHYVSTRIAKGKKASKRRVVTSDQPAEESAQ